MNTPEQAISMVRRRRRRHSEAFKADAVAACLQPGVSIAAVALSRGLSANLLRRWVIEAERTGAPPASSASALPETTRGFVPVGACRAVLSEDPMDGTMFVFRSRTAKAIKLLVYDGQGFWLAQKRLSTGRFRHWPSAADAQSRLLLAHESTALIWGGNPQLAQAAPMWRRITLDPPGK